MAKVKACKIGKDFGNVEILQVGRDQLVKRLCGGKLKAERLKGLEHRSALIHDRYDRRKVDIRHDLIEVITQLRSLKFELRHAWRVTQSPDQSNSGIGHLQGSRAH